MELYDCINFILNSTQNAVHSYFKEKLLPFDVTPIQYSVLKCLWDTDMQTPTQLSQILQVDTSTITGLIERMERKSLVTRTYSQEDRRSIQVCLTEEGRRLQPGIEAAIQQANVEVTRGLEVNQVAELKRQCQLMKENARRG
ncbi:MAG: MarR family transcriptional regulator [Lawsonibacter sp.]